MFHPKQKLIQPFQRQCSEDIKTFPWNIQPLNQEGDQFGNNSGVCLGFNHKRRIISQPESADVTLFNRGWGTPETTMKAKTKDKKKCTMKHFWRLKKERMMGVNIIKAEVGRQHDEMEEKREEGSFHQIEWNHAKCGEVENRKTRKRVIEKILRS